MIRKPIQLLLFFLVLTGGVALLPGLRPADAATLPAVISISPQAGPVAGGTSITINGTSFTGVQYVDFDGQHVVPTSSTSTRIVVVSPAHAAGVVNLRVMTAAGQSLNTAADNFTYMNVPTVTSVSPNTGGTSGGTSVTIHGTNLAGVTSVRFGDSSVGPTWADATTVIAQSPAHYAGVVHVRVVSAGGTSPTSALDQFTYVASGPVVTNVTPNTGPTSGGTLVTIDGSGFLGASYVSFGGAIVVPTSVTDTRIVVVSPAHASGVVHVLVTTPLGTSVESVLDQFTYGSGYPQVISISPNSGPTSGGTLVTITGTGLSNTVLVYFGETAVAPFSSTATKVLVYSPVHEPGAVHVLVTTLLGTSTEVASDYFTFTAATPVVTGVTPASGPVSGGTTVTIRGRSLSGAQSVSFGDTAVVPTVVSDTELRVISPTGRAAGIVDLRVTTSSGVTGVTADDNFLYVSSPRVTAVTPNSGSAGGGAFIVIHGVGFTGATVVNFGTAQVAPAVVTDTEIQVTTPPHEAGVVHLRITSTGGTSPDSAADDFTFTPAGPTICPALPLWVNDLAYGSAGGGFYWDPVSGLVWTAQRNWHPFGPQPARPAPQALWVNALTYGSAGGGFYWDPVSGSVWTPERGWHAYAPTSCVSR